MTVITHPTAAHLFERIWDAQNWVDSLEEDLACLRDESLNWRDFWCGTVAKPDGTTEREMQDRAKEECAAALEQAQRDLEALEAQQAATKRQGGTEDEHRG